MKRIRVFVVRDQTLREDLAIYPGKIIQADSVDALGYVMGVDPAFIPEEDNITKVRRILEQVNEE